MGIYNGKNAVKLSGCHDLDTADKEPIFRSTVGISEHTRLFMNMIYLSKMKAVMRKACRASDAWREKMFS